MNPYIHTPIHKHTYIYIHTYMHTYIHTYTVPRQMSRTTSILSDVVNHATLFFETRGFIKGSVIEFGTTVKVPYMIYTYMVIMNRIRQFNIALMGHDFITFLIN